MSGGELFHYLVEKEKVGEEEAVGFLKQILEGVRHLHDRNIVHLDLKVNQLFFLCISHCLKISMTRIAFKF